MAFCVTLQKEANMWKKFFRRAVPAAAIFAFIVVTTTCQSLQSVLREPVLSFRSAELVRINVTGVDLLFKVNVENPNPFTIPFPEIDWEFFINTNSFVSGAVEHGQYLTKQATTVVDVPVRFEYLEVFNTFASLRGSGQADYKVALDLKFTLPVLGDKVWHLEHEGVFPIFRAPSISFSGISVKNLSLTKIEFEAVWEVDNPNIFAMNIKDFSYNLSVNNSQWASGKIPGAPRIGAGGKTQIPLVFSIDSLSMVTSITRIITAGTDVTYSCSGNAGFGADLPGLDDYNYPLNLTGTTKLKR